MSGGVWVEAVATFREGAEVGDGILGAHPAGVGRRGCQARSRKVVWWSSRSPRRPSSRSPDSARSGTGRPLRCRLTPARRGRSGSRRPRLPQVGGLAGRLVSGGAWVVEWPGSSRPRGWGRHPRPARGTSIRRRAQAAVRVARRAGGRDLREARAARALTALDPVRVTRRCRSPPPGEVDLARAERGCAQVGGAPGARCRAAAHPCPRPEVVQRGRWCRANRPPRSPRPHRWCR